MITRTLLCLALMTSSAFATDWTIDPERSTLKFQGTQGGTLFDGSFERFTAAISLDPENLKAASIVVTIDTASATSGSAERDGTLPTADWFDVAAHPNARFMSNMITNTNDEYQATGALTIKGTSRDVVLPFTLNIVGEEAHATGSLTIDRNDYGVGTGALSPMVGADVTISIDITATR